MNRSTTASRPPEPRFWIYPVAPRVHQDLFGLTVCRVRIVRDDTFAPAPAGAPRQYEGFAIFDLANHRLERLFVVRERDHCVLEWQLQPEAPGVADTGPLPVRRSSRWIPSEGEPL